MSNPFDDESLPFLVLHSWAGTPRYHGKAVLFAATQTLLPQWDIQALWSPYLDELEVHRLCA